MIPSPVELGFNPNKFPSWRTNQVRAIEDFLGSDKRFIGQMQKVGSGKSLVYMAQATLSKSRAMILTGTKGLQSQLLDDFHGNGLVDIRGKSNYECSEIPGHTCEEGTVAKCPYHNSTMCRWRSARDEANNAPYVTTNYSCWISTNKYGSKFTGFDLLIMDEAHSSPDALSKAMQTVISDQEVVQMLEWDWPEEDERQDMECWKTWAQQALVRANMRVQALKDKMEKKKPSLHAIQEYKHYQNLSRKITEVARCKPETWVCDEHRGGYHGWQFDPVDASEYGESILFNGIPKVVLTSGTISSRTLKMLGIQEDEFDFFEYQGHFNPSKSPLIFIPTAHLHKDSPKRDLDKVVGRIDEIIETRGDRRGIIHTGNFKMRDYIMSKSEYSRFMISNYTENKDIISRKIEQFKETKPPVLLVSPSITTGYDFPGDSCRYQIIAKLPYPDFFSAKVDLEREKEDPNRGIYHMWQSLAQSLGRGDRSDKDWVENFILDSCIEKAMLLHGTMAPWWLIASYRKLLEVPMPPEILEEESKERKLEVNG